jgi:hypothetical protein
MVGNSLESDLITTTTLSSCINNRRRGITPTNLEPCAGYMDTKGINEPADRYSPPPDTTPSGDTGARPVSVSKLETNPFSFPTEMSVPSCFVRLWYRRFCSRWLLCVRTSCRSYNVFISRFLFGTKAIWMNDKSVHLGTHVLFPFSLARPLRYEWCNCTLWILRRNANCCKVQVEQNSMNASGVGLWTSANMYTS